MKMKSMLCVALMALLPSVAHAGGSGDNCGKYGGSYDHGGNCVFMPTGHQQDSKAWNNYYNQNKNYSNSYSQSQAQAQAQARANASVYGGNNTGGNVSVNDKTNVPPPAMAPAVATGNVNDITCRTGYGLSAGAMGLASLGWGSTAEDEDCTERENIKIVSTINPALADEMLNDLKGVKEAKARLTQNPPPPPPQVIYVPVAQSQPEQPTYTAPVVNNTPLAPPRIVSPPRATPQQMKEYEEEPGS